LLIATATLRAQNEAAPPMRFDHIHRELGLSQNYITCMLQDRKGFLWLGTKDGLNRFGGHRFIVYQHDTFDSISLSSSYITALCEDREGRL